MTSTGVPCRYAYRKGLYGGQVDHTWPTQQRGFNDAGLGCAYSDLEMIGVFSADRIGYLLAETAV